MNMKIEKISSRNFTKSSALKRRRSWAGALAEENLRQLRPRLLKAIPRSIAVDDAPLGLNQIELINVSSFKV